MAATLSYKDQFAWGLRVNPSFDQLAKSATKKFKFQKPDRSAKWWALSNYRAFMLDAASKYNDYEHARLDYNQSGARAPSAVAEVQPAAEGYLRDQAARALMPSNGSSETATKNWRT